MEELSKLRLQYQRLSVKIEDEYDERVNAYIRKMGAFVDFGHGKWESPRHLRFIKDGKQYSAKTIEFDLDDIEYFYIRAINDEDGVKPLKEDTLIHKSDLSPIELLDLYDGLVFILNGLKSWGPRPPRELK